MVELEISGRISRDKLIGNARLEFYMKSGNALFLSCFQICRRFNVYLSLFDLQKQIKVLEDNHVINGSKVNERLKYDL